MPTVCLRAHRVLGHVGSQGCVIPWKSLSTRQPGEYPPGSMRVQSIALFLAPLLQTRFSWLFPWKQTMVLRAPGPGKAGVELCNYLHASCSLQKWMLCLGYTVFPVSTAIASRAHWHPFLPMLQGTGGFSSWAVEHRCGISSNRKRSSYLQSQRSREHRPGRGHEREKGPGKYTAWLRMGVSCGMFSCVSGLCTITGTLLKKGRAEHTEVTWMSSEFGLWFPKQRNHVSPELGPAGRWADSLALGSATNFAATCAVAADSIM